MKSNCLKYLVKLLSQKTTASLLETESMILETYIFSSVANTNKDHQIMMVDPILMIVQNLRLFLTAVIPTAVSPTSDKFGPYWTILNHIEPY